MDLATPPGAVTPFEGRHANRRVTPVAGTHPRINSVLTYGAAPDVRLTDLPPQLSYGRTLPTVRVQDPITPGHRVGSGLRRSRRSTSRQAPLS
jgi:hypothetical protein